jgi:single-stranded DNA-binding protein
MAFVNAAQISGVLREDAIQSIARDGKKVTRFTISTSRKWIDKSGRQHNSAEWLRVAARSDVGKVASSLKKGDAVFIYGALRNGPNETVEILADTILRLDPTPLSAPEENDVSEAHIITEDGIGDEPKPLRPSHQSAQCATVQTTTVQV